MMSDHWLYVTVMLRGPAAEEFLMSAAEISGCIGTEIENSADNTTMRAYYRADEPIETHRARLLAALDGHEAAVGECGEIENQPWSRQSEEAFPPLSVGEGLVVLAPWHRGTEPVGRLPIYVNPGSAFGTGYHASTQTALSLLERRKVSGAVMDKVIDIGTGSGILSIASIKLGASSAYARDIDPAVISEARANIELNDIVAGTIIVETGDLLKGVEERYDLLFANILLEPNMRLLPSAASVLRPGGAAIFSGMTKDESGQFLDAMASTPLKVVETMIIEEWWGVLAEYPA